MQVPPQFAVFPVINATLNGTSAVLLLTRAQADQERAHGGPPRTQADCCGDVDALFCFVSLLPLPRRIGTLRGHGAWRPIYFTLLTSHTILAAAIVPMVIITLTRALRERFDRHRVIARWTYPLWLYVSVTGVIIYFMLYHLFAGGEELFFGLLIVELKNHSERSGISSSIINRKSTT